MCHVLLAELRCKLEITVYVDNLVFYVFPLKICANTQKHRECRPGDKDVLEQAAGSK